MTTPPARATCATPGCAADIVRERLVDGDTRWVHRHTGAELCWPGGVDVAAPAFAPVHQRDRAAFGGVARRPARGDRRARHNRGRRRT